MLNKIGILVLIIAAFGVSILAVKMPFMLDDFFIINCARQNLSSDHYSWKAFGDFLLRGHLNQFMPLRNLVDLGTYFFFGTGSSAPYHILLAVFHVIVTLCCWRLVKYIGGDNRLAFVSAFLFSIFPYHFMSIWWIANLGNPLTFFCFLFAFFNFIKWVEGRAGKYSLAGVFLWINLSFFSSYQGGVYPLVFLAYAVFYRRQVKKGFLKIGALLFAIFVFDYLWFSFRQNYSLGPEGLIKAVLYNSSTVWSRVLMFDIFANPAMPAGRIATASALALLCLVLFIDVLKNRSKLKAGFAATVTLLGVVIFSSWGTAYLTNYLSTVFFIYYLIFGNRIQRFSVLLMFIFCMSFLTTGRGNFSDRYLYSPNFAFSILAASIILNNIGWLPLNKYFKNTVLVLILAAFTLVSAIFYDDKFHDWYSVSNLQWDVINEVAMSAPQGVKVVHANSTTLFGLNIPIRKWLGRPDLDVYEGFGAIAPGFLLGDAYFIDFDGMTLPVQNTKVEYETEGSGEIRVGRCNAFLYNKIKSVNFHDGQNGYIVLEPQATLQGAVVNRKPGAYFSINSGDATPGCLEVKLFCEEVSFHLISTETNMEAKDNIPMNEFKLPVAQNRMKILIKNICGNPIKIFNIRYILK